MLHPSIFRERALIRRAEPDPLDDPTQVTAPHEWVLLVALAATLVGAVAWAVFGTVERTLPSDGALLRSGERHTLVSAVSGSVTEILVSVGDAVDAGTVIAHVQAPDLDWRIRMARTRIAKLEEAAAGADQATAADLREALTSARTELIELAATQAAGGLVVSPHAGEIAAVDVARGQAIAAGMPVAEVRGSGDGVLEAVLFLPSERVQQIHLGMPARVAVTTSERVGSRLLAAEVAHVSPRPALPSPWLARFAGDAEPAGGGYVVRLTLKDEVDARVADGTLCRVEIVLGESSPLSLVTAAWRSE